MRVVRLSGERAVSSLARRAAVVASAVLASCAAHAAAQAPDDHAFDACGTLARGASCVVFEGGGGSYYLADYGGYQVGDRVRVVGTLNESCITICEEIDGCISGAVVYDATQLPCGSAIPSLKDDLAGSLCSTAGLGLLGAAAGGVLFLGRRANDPSGRC